MAWLVPLGLPLALVIILRSAPAVDARWEDRPAHFWIVLAAGVLNAALALAITEAGRRRRDARLLLIGLAFLVSAGFLGLHALATPGEIVSGANAGFVLATPVGLVLSGVLAAASAVEYGLEASLKIVRHSRALTAAALGVIVAWAVVSLNQLPPLRDAITPSDATLPLAILAAGGIAAYGYAAFAYFRVWMRRRTLLAIVVAFAFALLAEALVVAVVSLPTSWRMSWWEWHVLMAIGFGAIAAAAWTEWYEERFSGLYLDETLAGHRDVSVLFADLSGFTPFSEAQGPEAVHGMLVAYFGELAPMMIEFGGEVQDFVGDQKRLGEQRERERDDDRQQRPPAQPDAEVRERGVAVGGDPARRQDRQRHGGVRRRVRVAQRRQLVERDDRPRDDHAEHRRGQRARVADDLQRRLEPVLDRARRGQHAGEHEPDRRGEHEPGVRAAHDLPGRGQRVQAEEPGADQEREPDQQEPRIPSPASRFGDRERESRVEHTGREHDPEVRRPVLPARVDIRRRAQQDHQRKWQRQRHDPRHRAVAHVRTLQIASPGESPPGRLLPAKRALRARLRPGRRVRGTAHRGRCMPRPATRRRGPR